MTETTNLHLTKDAETDYYSVARVNANSDKIDAFAGQVDTALSGKVDKEQGKGLSTEDFSSAEKTKLAGLENYDDTALQVAVLSLQSGKVDKVQGKGLSTEDFSTAEKTKLAGLENYDDTAVRAALKTAVNGGAKNKFCKQTDRPSTATENGVTLTWQTDGTIALNGTASAQTTFYLGLGYDGGDFVTGDILSGVPAGSSGLTLCIQLAVSPYTKYANDTGNGATIPATVVSGSPYRILLVIASGTNTAGMIVKPMICSPELWALDHAYQPYAPTNRELYEMFIAMGGGS